MKHIKPFKIFEKNISYIKKNVNIRVDVEASRHAMDRFYRHDPMNKIEEGDIIDVIDRSIEELTIALMQNRLNIEEKFILKDKDLEHNEVIIKDNVTGEESKSNINDIAEYLEMNI